MKQKKELKRNGYQKTMLKVQVRHREALNKRNGNENENRGKSSIKNRVGRI